MGNELLSDPPSKDEAISHLRNSLEKDVDWPTALLESIALWTVPRETYHGREYNYFILGEAFDWLLLAERLCDTVEELVPKIEKENLLFTGKFPDSFDKTRFKDLLGHDKYRGYLNFYYGVVVEEALQFAVEQEVHKRYLSRGIHYRDDFSDEVSMQIYRSPMGELFDRFRDQVGHVSENSISLGKQIEFTYWLFQYRLKKSDKAKIASDTRKGLEQLRRMSEKNPSIVSYT